MTRYPQSGDIFICEIGTSSLSHGNVAPFINAVSGSKSITWQVKPALFKVIERLIVLPHKIT